jgi:hypothetical protein
VAASVVVLAFCAVAETANIRAIRPGARIRAQRFNMENVSVTLLKWRCP